VSLEGSQSFPSKGLQATCSKCWGQNQVGLSGWVTQEALQGLEVLYHGGGQWLASGDS
jgi:hypothetical protein